MKTRKRTQTSQKLKRFSIFKKNKDKNNTFEAHSQLQFVVNIRHPGVPYEAPEPFIPDSPFQFEPRSPSHSPPSVPRSPPYPPPFVLKSLSQSPLYNSNSPNDMKTIINLLDNESSDDTKSSPEIQSLETCYDIGHNIRNEKYSTYKSIIVYLLFTTKIYNFEHNYKDIVTVRINTSGDIKKQIKHALLSLTKSKEKKHILICSTSILQNEEHKLSTSIVKSINKQDENILHKYNECLQDYGKLNIIHSNITIFHCVIGNEINDSSTSPRLQTVYIRDTTVPVFNKILNFFSIRKNENLERGLYMNKYDDSYKLNYKMIPYINKNYEWWTSFYHYNLSYMRGNLFQLSGTCWFHCVINLILLSPLANDLRTFPHIKKAKAMTFLQITNATKDKSLKELMYALFKNLLLKNTYPVPSDGNILLPIAARINSLTYRNNEYDFESLSFGNGNDNVDITTSKILKIVFNNKLIVHVYNCKTMDTSIDYLNKTPRDDVSKYANFCGELNKAPKTIDLFDQKYDLIGAIIGIQYDTNRHAVCGVILNGDEFIVDSNRVILKHTWSDCSKCTYTTKRPISKFMLNNCIYVKRKNETVYL